MADNCTTIIINYVTISKHGCVIIPVLSLYTEYFYTYRQFITIINQYIEMSSTPRVDGV